MALLTTLFDVLLQNIPAEVNLWVPRRGARLTCASVKGPNDAAVPILAKIAYAPQTRIGTAFPSLLDSFFAVVLLELRKCDIFSVTRLGADPRLTGYSALWRWGKSPSRPRCSVSVPAALTCAALFLGNPLVGSHDPAV